MIVQQVTVDVARPATELYKFVVSDYVENHPRWDARTLKTELTSADGLVVGALGIEVRKQMGRENTYNFRVTELTSDHITFEATGGGTTFGATWAVTAAETGSRLTVIFKLSMGGLLRLFEPFARSGVRKDMEQASSRIKELVEAS